jgi:RNA polymerase sigma-70 factor (ECF subfamily)
VASPSAVVGAPRSMVCVDDARLRRVVREYYDFVWRALRRMGVAEHGAEDAAQQVFLVIANKLEGVSYENERSFLFGTIVRVAADARRAQSRRREVNGEEVEEPIDESPSAEVMVDERKARAMLDAILRAMPDDLRAVFILCELEELDAPEVADVLGVPVGTVASRLRRAREHFQAAASRLQRRTRQP